MNVMTNNKSNHNEYRQQPTPTNSPTNTLSVILIKNIPQVRNPRTTFETIILLQKGACLTMKITDSPHLQNSTAKNNWAYQQKS